uniref:Protein zyg-11 homolog B n=2 Tax=Cacopsylla melanoneura TaxID=428564 RepID=A0A8D8YI04_9HEMI
MYEHPQSLKDVCIDFICDNVQALVQKDPSVEPVGKQNELVYSNDNMFLPQTISEQLLTTLSAKNQLNDFTMGMFDHKHCTLSEIYLPDAKNLTTRGLRKLKQHKICAIKVFEMKVAVNDLIGCLGEWTLNNLKCLNVTDSSFLQKNYCFIIIPISKLKSLHTLNVRCTEFNNHGLEIVVEDLPCIQCLDISRTRISDISLLKKIKHRLRYLAMHNIHLTESIVDTLAQLRQLRLLDISEEKSSSTFEMEATPPVPHVNSLLKQQDLFPYITSLDLSGQECVEVSLVEFFVKSHPSLKFLGVVHCDCCDDTMFTDSTHPYFNPELQVAGTANESQIILSLQHYSSIQACVQKSLYKLFRLTQDYYQLYSSDHPRPDIIRLVLDAMNRHENVYGIQMAATACVYNLTKGAQAKMLHPTLLRHVVQSTLNAMANFPIHLQLQKNALLTLCSDRILQDVSYDKYRCATLVMDCLCSFEDPSMNRMCVAICSILAAKIPTRLTSKLGVKPPYMVKLLSIVHRKTVTKQPDMTLRFTLSALWNLTDESPETCETFIMDGGLKLYHMVLENFAGNSAIETKVLGLINNIAEVPHLRHHLCDSLFLEVLGNLLGSPHIDVSYFAAGILSHLACHGETTTRYDADLRGLLDKLSAQVQSWEAPDGEMVAYRSFKPFEPLLVSEHPEVKLWAVWAIQHVCARNPARYCAMLERESGSCLIRQMEHDDTLTRDSAVLKIVSNIVKLLDSERAKRKGAELILTCDMDEGGEEVR